MRKITDIASHEERLLFEMYDVSMSSDQMALDLAVDILEDANYHTAAKVLAPYYKGVYNTYGYASKINEALRWDVYGAAIVACLLLEEWGHPLAEELNDFVVKDDPSIFD
jgi:hypothetical protein